MGILFSAKFEDRCSICGKKTIVFRLVNEETKKVVAICEECAPTLDKTMTKEQVIEKYGVVDEDALKGGVRIERGNAAS